MANSNIGYRNWAIAVYAVLTNLKGVSSMKLHRDLGITQSSAWFLLHRIREAWFNGTTEPFEGPVEADEMYVGGKAKNMSTARHRTARHRTARHRNAITGRGGVDKVPVAGVKDRATNKVAARPVADTSAASLVPFVASHAQPGAEVFTDEHRSYKPLASLGYCHAAVAHSARQWTDGTASTNGIESLWSMFRRGYAGIYHHMSRAHVGRYVNEFTGRHNIRPSTPRLRWAAWPSGWSPNGCVTTTWWPPNRPPHPLASFGMRQSGGGRQYPQAINVTGGYSPTRRGEQPAPTLPRQSRSTR